MLGQSLLYPGGGVGMGQGVVVAGGGEGVEGMKGLHAGDCAGDHGDGVGRHEGHVVGGAAQGQRVVGWTGGSQDVVGPEGLHVVVGVVLRVLHLQGHDLLLLAVSQIIGGAAPLRGQAVATHLVSLVALVVEGSKSQDVEEEERRPHGNCHAELGGVVSGVPGEKILPWPLGALRIRV